MANCPKCGTSFSAVTITDIKVGTGKQKKWNGISYDCPSCGTSLGVQVNPVALKDDTVSEILDALKGRH